VTARYSFRLILDSELDESGSLSSPFRGMLDCNHKRVKKMGKMEEKGSVASTANYYGFIYTIAVGWIPPLVQTNGHAGYIAYIGS
jgi:hypothetical protein